MKKLYYVNIPEMLGIKTNIRKFRWGFGRCSDVADKNEFDKCQFKVYLDICSDKKIINNTHHDSFDKTFRHYKYNTEKASLLFTKKILGIINLSFMLYVNCNDIHVVTGKNYYRFIKTKIMYYHPIAYIMFDVVSLILLLNGYSTIYCSSAKLSNGKNIMCMAAPDTGKSLTVLKLNNKFNAKIISEDMAITDGYYIWGAEHTYLYRKYKGQSLKVCKEMISPQKQSVDYIFFLQKSNRNYIEKKDIYNQCLLINRYSLGYYYSPVVRVIDLFGQDGITEKALSNEKVILKNLLQRGITYEIEVNEPIRFADIINKVCND